MKADTTKAKAAIEVMVERWRERAEKSWFRLSASLVEPRRGQIFGDSIEWRYAIKVEMDRSTNSLRNYQMLLQAMTKDHEETEGVKIFSTVIEMVAEITVSTAEAIVGLESQIVSWLQKAESLHAEHAANLAAAVEADQKALDAV